MIFLEHGVFSRHLSTERSTARSGIRVGNLGAPEDRIKAHQLIKYIQSTKNYIVIPASQELFHAGMQLHEARPDKAWSLTDCVSFVFMERQGIRRALAFDHHFTQAGFEALLRRDPP
jgi:predicted nucleic acid-binding protein